MASLGEESARVRVRRLTEDEAFLLGALHLQALRRRGVDPGARAGAPGHVQELATAWRTRSQDLPAWVAECDEQHVGMAVCRVPALPRVGRGVPELLALEVLGPDRKKTYIKALIHFEKLRGVPAPRRMGTRKRSALASCQSAKQRWMAEAGIATRRRSPASAPSMGGETRPFRHLQMTE